MAKIKVSVEKIDGYCNLPIQVGDYFYIEDSKLMVPDGQHVCIWALQSMMPIFPILNVRDRLEDGHWVKTVKNFVCPDPGQQVADFPRVEKSTRDLALLASGALLQIDLNQAILPINPLFQDDSAPAPSDQGKQSF